MGLIDSIIGAESGGDPNARNPNSSATGAEGSFTHVCIELFANSLVGKLLLAGRPATVIGRIALGAVFAIKRVSLARARPHICKEVLEAFTPTVANRNPERAVIFIGNVRRLLAPTNHAIPNLVFIGSATAARLGLSHAVNVVRVIRAGFLVAAPACGCVAGEEVGRTNQGRFSAIALASQASDFSAAIWSDLRLALGKNDQKPKSLSYALSWGSH
jgi:hypothetical protein